MAHAFTGCQFQQHSPTRAKIKVCTSQIGLHRIYLYALYPVVSLSPISVWLGVVCVSSCLVKNARASTSPGLTSTEPSSKHLRRFWDGKNPGLQQYSNHVRTNREKDRRIRENVRKSVRSGVYPPLQLGLEKSPDNVTKIPPLASASIYTTWILWTRVSICAHAAKLAASVKVNAPVFVLPAETKLMQHSAWCLCWIWCRGRTTRSLCDLLGRPGVEMSNLASFHIFWHLSTKSLHMFSCCSCSLWSSPPIQQSTNSTVRQGPSSVKRKPLFKTERDVASEKKAWNMILFLYLSSSLVSRFSSFAVVRTLSMRDDLLICDPFHFWCGLLHERVVSNTSRKMSWTLKSSSLFSPSSGTLAHFCSKLDFSFTKVWKLEQHKESKCCGLELWSDLNCQIKKLPAHSCMIEYQ